MELVVYDDSLKHLQAAADTMVGEVKPFLKFQKGDYLLGQDLEEVPVGTRLAVTIEACGWGWVRWNAGKPVERRMVRIASGEPRALRDDLGHHDTALWDSDEQGSPKDPWSPNFELPMREVDGEQREVIFTGSSRGVESAVRDLIYKYAAQARRHQGEAPIIELRVDRYTHRTFGIVKTPKLPIVGWLSDASNADADTGHDTSLEADLDDDIPF